MKWYWVVLIVLVVLAITYWIAVKGSQANKTTCRPGTCPYVRSDGSIFCTSAACKHADDVQKTFIPQPQRTLVFVKAPTKNTGVSTNTGISTNASVGHKR